MASACSEGLGSTEFREAQAKLVALGPDGFLQSIISKPLADVDEWSTELQLKSLRRGRVELYTDGLSEAEQRITGVEAITSVEAAVRESMVRTGDPNIAVIPEALTSSRSAKLAEDGNSAAEFLLFHPFKRGASKL